MEKKLCSYEVLYIVDATISDEEIRAAIDKFSALINANATDVTVNEWGKRRLAYPIRDINDGFAVLVHFKSEPTFPRELERQMRIADSTLRVMITRKEFAAAPAAEAPAAEAQAETSPEAEATQAEPESPAEQAPAE